MEVRGVGQVPQAAPGPGAHRAAHVRGVRQIAAAGDAGDGAADVDATGDADAEPLAVPQVARQAENKIRLLPLAQLVAGADRPGPAKAPAALAEKRVVASNISADSGGSGLVE